jgi:hypothetical protein
MPRHATTSARPHATPVYICAHCHTCHDLSCAGQLSMVHRAWYCSPLCYQMQRMLNGEPMTQGVMRVLCESRDEHFPSDKLLAQFERTEDLIETKQIREVKHKEIRDELDA